MNTCLVFPTSYEYWFNERLRQARPYRPLDRLVSLDPPSGGEWERTIDVCERLGFSSPLHVLVTEARHARHAADNRVVHRIKPPIGLDVFGRIDHELFIESPEMLFVRASSRLSLAQLAHLGCSLCGNFALDESQVGGVTYREPITTPERLVDYTRRNSHLKGAAQARKALNLGFVVPGARSPKEVELMLLLCLPPRYGGYGLPWPVLNKQIDIQDRDRNVVAQSHFVGDLVWEMGDAKLIVEYDSRLVHEDKYDLDKERAGKLVHLGYKVISVTPRMLYDLEEMERVALRAARILGKSFRKENLGAISTRLDLRRQLLRLHGPDATH